MAKFVMECSSCGRYVEAKTGVFARRKIECECGHTIHVRTERLVTRTCPNCKAIYHIQNKPPKVEGVCDICGSQLVTRKDDTVESLQVRLEAYHESTKDVIGYYANKGIVKTINADQSVEKVFADIVEALGECND